MNSPKTPEQIGHANLRRLAWLRAVTAMIQATMLLLAKSVMHLNLPWIPLAATVGVLFLVDALVWIRLKFDYPVSTREIFFQLCIDVLALTLVLYMSGGSTNPFISLYLLPLVITAMTLPVFYSWGMSLITISCYSFLMNYYIPLQLSPKPDQDDPSTSNSMELMMNGMNHGGLFNFHVMGMWLGFIISVMVILIIVVRMAEAVRKKDGDLAKIREDNLRNEQIVALATLSASAAHELGTPLSTMAVIIGELDHDPNFSSDAHTNFELLNNQLANCRYILDRMLANTNQRIYQTAAEFMNGTIYEWSLLRPKVHCDHQFVGADSSPMDFDPTLRSALLNLLNNAADVSPDHVLVETKCDSNRLIITIEDLGPGIAPEVYALAGSAFFSTKEHGRGLGLLLANATINRLHGTISLFNRKTGGTTTEVILPINSLTTV